MGLWGKRLDRAEIPDGLGQGPGYASPPLGTPNWSQWQGGNVDQTPNVTVTEQQAMLRHWRLTDDTWGDISQRDRIDTSKEDEKFDYNGAGPEQNYGGWRRKQRDTSLEDPSRYPNPRHVRTISNVRFQREEFYQQSERYLNGDHFSMADHFRTYEIYGMLPAHPEKRNTYRVEPPPRDAFVEDRGPSVPYTPPYAVSYSPDTVPGNSMPHSYRLG